VSRPCAVRFASQTSTRTPNPGLEGAYSITAAKTIPESVGSCRLVENRVAAV
jgi:hypothetical protein